MGFPFRFYGRAPADWYEGANLGHSYEVAFVEAPSAEQQRAIMLLVDERLAAGPAETSTFKPWLWSGRFGRFAVGERWSGAARAAFARVADVLIEIHRRHRPIAQVLFLGAR